MGLTVQDPRQQAGAGKYWSNQYTSPQLQARVPSVDVFDIVKNRIQMTERITGGKKIKAFGMHVPPNSKA